jgi:hypothetical protein
MNKTMNEHAALSQYDDFLDEVYPMINICGYEYSPSRSLKEIDETAYRCGFNDWCDSEGIEVDYE